MGSISVRWFSNAEIFSGDAPLDLVMRLPNLSLMRQGKKSSKGQYEYKFMVKNSVGIFVLHLHNSSLVMANIDSSGQGDIHPEKWAIYRPDREFGLMQVRAMSE
jgi:hypothetical protein